MTKDIVPVLQKEISAPTTAAATLHITDEVTMTGAVELLSTLNKMSDRITDEKEKVTKPLNQALKAERARWKPMEEVLEDAITLVRKKMGTYQTAAKAKADAEAEKIAARVGEGRGKLRAETAVTKINELNAPEKVISADSGSVQFRTVAHHELMDAVLLANSPNGAAYLLPNDAAIRQAKKDGLELAGVLYWTTQEPYNTR